MTATPINGGSGAGGTFCTNCGGSLTPGAVACTACGFAIYSGNSNCWNCGSGTNPGQAVCTSCGASVVQPASPTTSVAAPKSRTTAGVLAIVLGWTGAHKFYVGRSVPGIIVAMVFWISACCGFFLFLPWVACLVVIVLGIAEGVLVLGKTDDEFQREIVQGGKDWWF